MAEWQGHAFLPLPSCSRVCQKDAQQARSDLTESYKEVQRLETDLPVFGVTGKHSSEVFACLSLWPTAWVSLQ